MPDQTFTSGQILTAAQMSSLQTNIGLVFIKSQTLTGADETVTDAFSTNFDNYKIIVGGGTLSSIANIAMIMGSTTAGYYSTRIINAPNAGTPTGNGLNNDASWGYAAQGNTTYINMDMDVFGPFESKYTRYAGSYLIENGADSSMGITQGHLANTTSYTSFKLTPGGATFTAGTVYVFGYRKA